jgi:thiol reductant ABC exporter CydD subunit
VVPGTAASVGLGLLAAVSVVVQAVSIARLLAGAMAGGSQPGRGSELAWLAGAVAVRAAVALAQEMVARRTASVTKADLRRRLVGAALAQAPGPEGSDPGATATLAGRGLDALDAYISRCLPDMVLAATVPLVLLAVVAYLDWVSAVVLAVVMGLFPVFGALVGRASLDLASERWQQVEALGRQVTDVFEGLATLRSLGVAPRQRSRIAAVSDALRDATHRTLKVAFLTALVLDTLASLSVALVAVPLGLRLLSGSIGLSHALAVLVIAPEVLIPLRRASAEFHESTEGLAAAGQALRILEAGTAPGGEGPAPGDPSREPVVIRGLTVSHPGRLEPALIGADLRLEPGCHVALVGPNGAGKSSLISVLLGFTAPTAGTVTCGVDLAAADPGAWRSHVTYLPEHPTVLAGTLAENLAFAAPGASDHELTEALLRAGGADLLAKLPDGLATRVGEGGRPLSAGECQRLAVARVLLRPAGLYLLDEPTAHLDERTEVLVVDALADAMQGRSAVIVTHRPAALRLADRVVAVVDGRLEEADSIMGTVAVGARR